MSIIVDMKKCWVILNLKANDFFNEPQPINTDPYSTRSLLSLVQLNPILHKSIFDLLTICSVHCSLDAQLGPFLPQAYSFSTLWFNNVLQFVRSLVIIQENKGRNFHFNGEISSAVLGQNKPLEDENVLLLGLLTEQDRRWSHNKLRACVHKKEINTPKLAPLFG